MIYFLWKEGGVALMRVEVPIGVNIIMFKV